MKAKFGKRALSLALILALAMATMLVPASAAPGIGDITAEQPVVEEQLYAGYQLIVQDVDTDAYMDESVAEAVEKANNGEMTLLDFLDALGVDTGSLPIVDLDCYDNEVVVSDYEFYPFYTTYISISATEKKFFFDLGFEDNGAGTTYSMSDATDASELTVTLTIEQLKGLDPEAILIMTVDPETGLIYFSSARENDDSPCGYDFDDETGEITTQFEVMGPFAVLIDTQNSNVSSVTYDAGGGEGTVKSTRYYYTGTEVTVEDGSNLTKEGYTFAGWVDEQGNSYADGDTITVTENIALTATWEANNVSVPVKVNMTLANNLAMNFYISKNGDETESSYTLYVTKDGETVALEWLDGDELYASEGFSEFEGCWVARYTGCYAYEYASELTVTLKSGDEEVTMTNNTFNANGTLNISISAYLNKIVEIYKPYISYAIYEKEVTMANAVLTYCEAAKVYNG